MPHAAWSRPIRSICPLCPAAAVAVTLLSVFGCTESRPPEFTVKDGIERLYEPAAVELRSRLLTTFGQPLDSVIWESMPARLHGAKAEVELEDADDSLTTFAVDLDEGYEMAPIEPGQQIVWTSGLGAGAVRRIASYDADEGLLEIDEPIVLEDPDDAEGMVAIQPGHILKQARPLYARHCQHCHGVTGDGAGPTAWSLNPKPRDFRQGKFKFVSTRTGFRPTRDDLVLTLHRGIDGTSMPSFKAMLTEPEMAAVTEYVVWLANRGEIEDRAIQVLASDFSKEAYAEAVEDEEAEDFEEEWTEFATEDLSEEFLDWGDAIASKWNRAESENAVVLPTVARTPMSDESVLSGRRIYLSAGAKCTECHGRQGLGNGAQTLAYQRTADGDGYYDIPGLHDSWGNPIQPRNLHRGLFRGGRRPVDIYRRIHAGITGANMPAFGGSLSEEQIWDVVNYVLAVAEDPQINVTLDAKIAEATPPADDDVPDEVASLP